MGKIPAPIPQISPEKCHSECYTPHIRQNLILVGITVNLCTSIVLSEHAGRRQIEMGYIHVF